MGGGRCIERERGRGREGERDRGGWGKRGEIRNENKNKE